MNVNPEKVEEIEKKLRTLKGLGDEQFKLLQSDFCEEAADMIDSLFQALLEADAEARVERIWVNYWKAMHDEVCKVANPALLEKICIIP